MPAAVSLPALVEQRSISDPNDPFLTEAVTGRSSTYAEVHHRSLAWAAALDRLDIAEQQTVLTMLPPCADAVCAWIGIAWLHAYEVSVNTGYRGRMLRYVIEDSQATVAVVHADYWLEFDRAATDTAISTVILLGGSDEKSDTLTVLKVDDVVTSRGERTYFPPAAHEIAAIIYTSGTTGPSKGVMLPWAQVDATADGIAPSHLFGPGDAFYSPFPMFHMSSKGPLVSMAKVGGTFVIKPRFDTKTFWQDVQRFGVTTTILIGAIVQFLLGEDERDSDAESSLRDALMLPLPPDLAGFEKRFGLRARTTFNMTETSCCIISDGYDVPNSQTCGVLRPGFSARIVDSNDFEVPDGQVGELVLRADDPWTLMAGYWGKAEATVDAWRNQWLHTGDSFRRDADGNYYFVDRLKDAIRRRGENISSAEVEADVNAHPDVLESSAVAVPSDQSEDEIMVFVVLKDNRKLTAEALASFLGDRMAPFMVPRYIEFLAALPKTPTHKIRKAELRTQGVSSATFDRGDGRRSKA